MADRNNTRLSTRLSNRHRSPTATPRNQAVSPNMLRRNLFPPVSPKNHTLSQPTLSNKVLTNLVVKQADNIYTNFAIGSKNDGVGSLTQEEHREVFEHLNIIRKKYDQTKQANSQTQKEIEKVQLELSKLNNQSKQANRNSEYIVSQIQEIEQEIENVKQKTENEIYNKKQYDYMLFRMKESQLHRARRSKQLGLLWSNLEGQYDVNNQEWTKTKEQAIKSRSLLDTIRMNIFVEKTTKEDHVSTMAKDLLQRQEATMRREDADARRSFIAAEAARKDQATRDGKIQEALKLHRFWHYFISKQMETEQYKVLKEENMFQQLRFLTGLKDVEEIVEVYFSLEQVHEDRSSKIKAKERRFEFLQSQQRESKHLLNEIRMLTQGLQSSQSTQAVDQQYDLAIKKVKKSKQSLQQATITYENLMKWVNEILIKLDKPKDHILDRWEVNFSVGLLEQTFVKLLQRVEEISQPALEDIGFAWNVIEELSYLPTNRLMYEIQHGDYISKNMRIQPGQLDCEESTSESEEQPIDIEEERKNMKNESKNFTEMNKKLRKRQSYLC